MPTVLFEPSKISIAVTPGTDLLDAAKQAGVDINAPCGTKGTCGRCIVRITAGETNTTPSMHLSPLAVEAGYVQACQTKVSASPLTVQIPEPAAKKGQFADLSADLHKIDADLLPQTWQLNPTAIKINLTVPAPAIGDGLSDLERLQKEIRKIWKEQEITLSLSALQALADSLRHDGGKVTATIIQEPSKLRIIQISSGTQPMETPGLAIDIGTTSVSVQLVSLPDARIIATRTDYNRQIACGVDIISRIDYARQPARLAELRTRVLQTVNELIKQLADEQAICCENICNCAISGNTTMIHLLLGLKPEYIRLDPYIPTILENPLLTATAIGLDMHPETLVHISPGVGSYVGGDITAGLLCTEMVTDSEQICFFIDIGTNGELVIGNSEFALACACSAGPAFEGGGIKHGMRAARGAIENVEIDPETGLSIYQTIDNTDPKGICGTGMISLLASLLKSGWMDSAGKLSRERPSTAIIVEGRQARYRVTQPADGSESIEISEAEIDNILRAKAAIFSACSLMLKQVELDFKDLDCIYIAGGFGHFLDLENAITIGLLPDVPREKFRYIGNASLMGSYMALVSQEHQQKQLETVDRITYVELSSDPGYMDQYTAALFLPHTDLALFPSYKPVPPHNPIVP
ncbi:MAG: DUF4445 domain-containing protein [SAR324 cluster bacterium]|nr:DUF4445 domain-containing protein [SAR324 cluster bacterium]